MKNWLTCLTALLVFGSSWADETEIFRLIESNSRPKVMIIFDNSGSMDIAVPLERPPYDPNTIYPTVPGIVGGRLYWTTSTRGFPPPVNTGSWFLENRNRCASSYNILNTQGVYIDRFARRPDSGTNWTTLSTAQTAPLHVDCRSDIVNNNNNNGTGTNAPGNGFPRDVNGGYGTRVANFGSNWTTYRVYTANYMNWWYSTTLPPAARSRMDIAREVVSNIIQSNPDIDFGLATFNDNSNNLNRDGGRIVQRIIENMTAAQRTNLVNIVNSLTSDTWTPLCESTYEVYRYLSGSTVQWGNITNPTNPPRDPLAQTNGRYISPLADCQNVYVILMTDGEPSFDTEANAAIRALTGRNCRNWIDYNNNMVENCLPELVAFMNTNDLDNNPANGIQRAITYTIGFATDQALLEETAKLGGGEYYTADDAQELTAAFQGALTSILSINTSFTSPAISIDSFSRAESRDEIFFAMFKPLLGTNWPGNIKKLRTGPTASGIQLVDRSGVRAIDSATNQIAASASTFWNEITDGPNVQQGGVGQLLRDRNPDTRVIFTNSGTGGALENFFARDALGNAINSFGTASSAERFGLFGVNNQTEFNRLIDWATGWENRSENRKRDWIMGDILNSRPIVLDYGARPGYTATRPDLRIVAGTNAGFVHMFRNTTSAADAAVNSGGDETWAFFPKELAPILAQRRADIEGAPHVYGVDGPIVVYRFDAPTAGNPNGSGVIGDDPDDRMILYFGLRRGGRHLYALDVTNPDAPVFKWQISDSTPGFSELGQTWSVPILTFIPGYPSSGAPKPVLVFGAGYDPAYDSRTTLASQVSPNQGRGIFIVDADTGSLIWSATPGANTATNRNAPFNHAIAATLTAVDGNGDGRTDIIYAPDVGGNIWRIDLGTNNPSSWVINRVAAIAGTGADDNHANDRRFFNAVDVSRNRTAQRSYYTLAIGSGDRANPNAVDNADRFYVFQDRQLTPFTTLNPSAPECNPPECNPPECNPPECNPTNGSRRDDIRCSWPITHAQLFDATSNIIQVGTEAERTAAQVLLDASSGWFLNLGTTTGEKVLSRSVTISGNLFFTTFIPNLNTAVNNVCEPSAGQSRLYVVNIRDARAVFDFNADSAVNTIDRFRTIGSGIFDTPSLFFRSDGAVNLITQGGEILDTGASIRRRFPTFWYQREF